MYINIGLVVVSRSTIHYHTTYLADNTPYDALSRIRLEVAVVVCLDVLLSSQDNNTCKICGATCKMHASDTCAWTLRGAICMSTTITSLRSCITSYDTKNIVQGVLGVARTNRVTVAQIVIFDMSNCHHALHVPCAIPICRCRLFLKCDSECLTVSEICVSNVFVYYYVLVWYSVIYGLVRLSHVVLSAASPLGVPVSECCYVKYANITFRQHTNKAAAVGCRCRVNSDTQSDSKRICEFLRRYCTWGCFCWWWRQWLAGVLNVLRCWQYVEKLLPFCTYCISICLCVRDVLENQSEFSATEF